MNKHSWVILIHLIFFTFIPLDGFIAAYAQSQSFQISPTTEAERVIIESVETGGIADLSIFPDEKNRIISAKFLENLLTGRITTITNKGVNIKNVTIDGNVELTNEVLPIINITDSVFTGGVNFQGSKFDGLSLSNSKFLKEAQLNKTVIYDSAYLDNTNFDGLVDLSFITVGRNIDLNHAYFSDPQTAKLNSMNIGDSAFMNRTVFDGPVDFGYTRINGILDLEEAQFNSSSESSFNSLIVGDSAFFVNTIFLGPVAFGHSKIGANLDFSGTKFNSPDRIIFNSVEISGSFIFQDVFFSSPAFFLYIEVGNLMDFSRSRFSSQYLVNFAFINIENGATFEYATFEGPVGFTYIDNNGSLNFDNTNFLNTANSPEFAVLRIRGSFSISNSSFYGGLIISNSTVENRLAGSDIQFLTVDRPIIINQSEIQSLSFSMATLTNTISFVDCTFFEFRLGGSEEELKFLSLNLSGTKITKDLSINNVAVKRFIGQNLVSFGKTNLENITIEEQVNLSFANFNIFIYQNVVWPKITDNLKLDGFTYREIIPGESLNEGNWQELLNLINASNYNVALYKDLEFYFDNYGHSDWADAVLVAQKRRERSDLLKWYSAKWWWNLFLDVLTLYGRRPSRAFVWSLFFIAIGYFTFRKKIMVRVEKSFNGVKGTKQYDPLWDPFWYSIDLFIPAVNLGISEKWEPSPHAIGALLYKRVLKIAGWLVIPVALLSITGYFQ